MTVKEKLKELFEKNRGKYLSGEEIAADLGCTRGASGKRYVLLKMKATG